MKKYENAGNQAIEEGTLEFSGTAETARLSLKVLDMIHENADALPVKYALLVLDDAKDILLQLLGV